MLPVSLTETWFNYIAKTGCVKPAAPLSPPAAPRRENA